MHEDVRARLAPVLQPFLTVDSALRCPPALQCWPGTGCFVQQQQQLLVRSDSRFLSSLGVATPFMVQREISQVGSALPRTTTDF